VTPGDRDSRRLGTFGVAYLAVIVVHAAGFLVFAGPSALGGVSRLLLTAGVTEVAIDPCPDVAIRTPSQANRDWISVTYPEVPMAESDGPELLILLVLLVAAIGVHLARRGS
jgi:hypothetical protein